MHDRLVTITRTGNNLSVDDPAIQPSPGEKISWTCSDPFAVFFKNSRNPLKSNHYVLGADGGEETKALEIRNLHQPEKGHGGVGKPAGERRTQGDMFNYGIAVLRPDTGRILTLDPDVIVDDLGGGGGGD